MGVTTDTTWACRLNGALDHIALMKTERDNAMEELMAFVREHPEFDQDDHLTTARLALL
jgi:hypothetical protein